MEFSQEYIEQHGGGAVAGDKEQSACIVITDPPSGLEIGIDCMTYETGELLKRTFR